MRSLLLFAVVALGGVVQAAERPNFVFLYTDDQRWDALGVVQREQGAAGRFPWIESPNFDRLAAEGVRFRNAFVIESLCAPSRAAFLTGRYGHLNGVVNNRTSFPEQSVTHATLLRAAGYRTGYFGKWHMGSQSGQRPGFDESASFVGQGAYFDCPIEVNGVKTPSTGFVDDVTTDYAIEFIRANNDRPFSMCLGFKTCHGPFTPPPRTAETYGNAESRSVPNLDVPAIYHQAETRDFSKRAGNVGTNLGMFRGLKAIDENVGKLLSVLDELGLAENTMVVFSSDNGYYLGEHHLGDKRTAYDESLRIPLLVRYPKVVKPGRVVDRMALNIDLAPTLVDYAGLDVPESMQGRSWRPLLEGDAAQADWRRAFFYFYPQEGKGGAPTVLAVRTDAAKLVYYPGHDEWAEMFDLSRDPYEVDNLYGKAEQADLQATLELEFERQRRAANFNLTDEELQSGFRGAPADAPVKPLDANVLVYDFTRGDDDARAVDKSGHMNKGRVNGAPLVAGRDGRKARKFDGKGSIEIAKSPSLNPAAGPLTVEATVLAEKPDGMIVACGGKTNGYALFVRDGKPGFAYNAANKTTTVTADDKIVGRHVKLMLRIDADRRVRLAVDGLEMGKIQLPAFIESEPNDDLQIGADLRSPVVDKLPSFTGLIEAVRIYSGDESAVFKGKIPPER